MIEPPTPVCRSLLVGATWLSDLVFQSSLERTARRLGGELGVPSHFIQQLLAIEDKRFAFHPGVDPLAIIRASIFNVWATPSRLHGASTITQQIYSGAARRAGRWSPTLGCKLAQSVWAIRATLLGTKAKVLKDYLDSVYFGRSFYGLDRASIGYCARLPGDLRFGDGFFLAERIGRPNVVSVRRVAGLVARRPIRVLFGADPSVRSVISEHYERHFGCGEEIARCLERSLRKPVERTCTCSAAVSSEL
jgi:hypothetical protein